VGLRSISSRMRVSRSRRSERLDERGPVETVGDGGCDGGWARAIGVLQVVGVVGFETGATFAKGWSRRKRGLGRPLAVVALRRGVRGVRGAWQWYDESDENEDMDDEVSGVEELDVDAQEIE
jgi:hypothetical protein